MPEYYEFCNLESLAEWLGYEYPEEIYEVANTEDFYGTDCCGDSYISKDRINDFLSRCNIQYRCTHAGGVIIVEHI